MFDLSPANLVGKYPGKTGLIMLMHLVQKVSRLLQPAVLYFEDAEKPFMKKIPKTDRTDPKRLKKDLQKIVKNIAPEDRVILIGVSNAPWVCAKTVFQQQKLMTQKAWSNNWFSVPRTLTKSSCSRPIIVSFSFHVQIMVHFRSPGVNYWRNKLNISQHPEWGSRVASKLINYLLFSQTIQRRLEKLRLGCDGKSLWWIHGWICGSLYTRRHHV